MRPFKVKCYDRSIWDEKEPRDIEAESALQAAELICGGPLVEGVGNLGSLRAEVWEPASPSAKILFRTRRDQI